MNTINKGTFYEFNDEYSIYEVNNDKNFKYFLCIPNNDNYNLTLYFGFLNEDYNLLTKKELTNEIERIYKPLFKSKPSSIYLVPVLDYLKLKNATMDNDDRTYQRMLNKFHTITHEVYELINKNNDLKLNDTIYGIKQLNTFDKFINWLELNMEGYIKGIPIKTIDDLAKQIELEDTQVISGNKIKKINEALFNSNSEIFNNNIDNDIFNNFEDAFNGDTGSAKGNASGNEKSNEKPLVKKLTLPKGKHGYINSIYLMIGSFIVSFFIGFFIIFLTLTKK